MSNKGTGYFGEGKSTFAIVISDEDGSVVADDRRFLFAGDEDVVVRIFIVTNGDDGRLPLPNRDRFDSRRNEIE